MRLTVMTKSSKPTKRASTGLDQAWRPLRARSVSCRKAACAMLQNDLRDYFAASSIKVIVVTEVEQLFFGIGLQQNLEVDHLEPDLTREVFDIMNEVRLLRDIWEMLEIGCIKSLSSRHNEYRDMKMMLSGQCRHV